MKPRDAELVQELNYWNRSWRDAQRKKSTSYTPHTFALVMGSGKTVGIDFETTPYVYVSDMMSAEDTIEILISLNSYTNTVKAQAVVIREDALVNYTKRQVISTEGHATLKEAVDAIKTTKANMLAEWNEILTNPLARLKFYLDQHDWYYQIAGDYGVWMGGDNNRSRLQLAFEIAHASHPAEAIEVWNAAAPIQFKKG